DALTSLPPAPQPLDVQQREQTDAEREHVDRGERHYLSEAPAAGLERLRLRHDLLGGVLEDVEEQEDEDAGGGSVEEGLEAEARALDAAHRQSQEDGETGDQAQRDRLCRAHRNADS